MKYAECESFYGLAGGPFHLREVKSDADLRPGGGLRQSRVQAMCGKPNIEWDNGVVYDGKASALAFAEQNPGSLCSLCVKSLGTN